MPAPIIEDADPPDGSESWIIKQKGRIRRQGYAGFVTWLRTMIPAGRSILVGNGAPQDVGSAGDLYIDAQSGDLYKKED